MNKMLKEGLFELYRPKFCHLRKLGNTAIEHLLIVSLRVRDDFPEVQANLGRKVGQFATAAKKRENLEFFNSKFDCWCLSDLRKNKFDVFLVQIVTTLVYDFKNFLLVVTFGKIPEHLQQHVVQKVLFEETAENVS